MQISWHFYWRQITIDVCIFCSSYQKFMMFYNVFLPIQDVFRVHHDSSSNSSKLGDDSYASVYWNNYQEERAKKQ